MKLIPDWRLAWRFLSVQAAVLLALLSGIQGEVLPLIAPLFPDHQWPYISGGLALTIVVLRLIAQDTLTAERELIGLDRLEADLETVPLQFQVPAPGAPSEQLMPAGRFERWLGGFALACLVVALVCAALAVWSFAR
jgi:hypothetical protein